MLKEMRNDSLINTVEYNFVIKKLRDFFLEKNFYEVCVQSRLSILAACEDPFTLSFFNWQKNIWPLPQTGQMWLEHELLNNSNYKGVFCISTSYRNEPNIIAGRHKTIFPMFEFESHGNFEDLKTLEKELLNYLGFNSISEITYKKACELYSVNVLKAHHEGKLCEEFSEAIFLQNFPEKSDAFWNMKFEENVFKKNDVILYGQETIGSAERSTDVEEMKYHFENVSEGKYCQKLFDLFGKERVEKELNEYLSYDFFPRFGGGIGITRLIRAINKLDEEKINKEII